jgi:HAMP domain-containing protein
MIVTCQECGKKYHLNPSKIKGNEATGTCTSCNCKIRVYHPGSMESSLHEIRSAETSSHGGNPERDIKEDKEKKDPSAASNRRLFGLRGKIFILFFMVPIALIIIAGYLFLGQLNSLSSLISDESIKVVTLVAEQIIVDKGRDVAREVKNYLESHPELAKEDFNKTPEFVEIAMQKVGETGYTLLVERETPNQPVYMWVHPNEKLLGIDITGAMKERLGERWERWDKIRSKAWETKGYYTWFDNREKYCAGIPIEGTPYNIVSSTYIDEFTKPMLALQNKATFITTKTQRFVLWIICGTTLLVALITLFYGHRLTKRIRGLTHITDRISVGEMDVDIVIRDKDELGDLAQAISRMQDSIRLSIERLRRRRNRQAA